MKFNLNKNAYMIADGGFYLFVNDIMVYFANHAEVGYYKIKRNTTVNEVIRPGSVLFKSYSLTMENNQINIRTKSPI